MNSKIEEMSKVEIKHEIERLRKQNHAKGIKLLARESNTKYLMQRVSELRKRIDVFIMLGKESQCKPCPVGEFGSDECPDCSFFKLVKDSEKN